MMILSHCGPVPPYGDINHIRSGNGLVSHDTKPLPEPMLTYHWYSTVTFI